MGDRGQGGGPAKGLARRDRWLWALIIGVVLLTVPFLLERAALERDNDTVELAVDLESIRLLSEYTGAPVDELLADWAARGVISVGIADPDDIVWADEVGLRVVPRTVAVLSAVRDRSAAGVGPFMAAGDEMPGYPDDLTYVAELLDRTGIPLGIVEFAQQLGERDLARLLNDVVVFVHSIPPRELVRLTDEQALARFNRAVLERQARVLYIHPLLPESADGEPDTLLAVPLGPSEQEALLVRNGQYVSALADRIGELGLMVGPVQPAPRWTSPAWVPAAVMVAAVAAALLVGRLSVRVSWKWETAALVAAAVGMVVLVAAGRDVLARQAAALAVACVFPALAVAVGARPRSGDSALGAAPSNRGASTLGTRPAFGELTLDVVKRFGAVVAVTVVGAALVAAALTDTRFFLKLEQFRGVKLAHLLPMGLVAALWAKEALQWAVAASASDARSGADRVRSGLESLYRLVWPIGWRHVVTAIVVAGAVFVLIARTGHYVLPVPDWERAAREALERWLVVRPRTKEFVLGYPALLIGLVALVGGRRNLGWPLLIAGSVASISVINTFAHAHVGLGVSLVRTLYGMLLGAAVALLGLLVLAVWLRTDQSGHRRPTHGARRGASGAGPTDTGMRLP